MTDIQYTLLGFLNWQPLSGYDLKKMIADSELFYWSGNNNQIYNSLVELHKKGWVSQETQLQETLPAKKIYTLTPAGRAELRGWLLTHVEIPEFRHNFLIQLAWSSELTGDELDALLARYAEEISLQYQMRVAQQQRQPARPDRTAREKLIWDHIEENMLAAYRYELEWVRQLQQDLKGQGF